MAAIVWNDVTALAPSLATGVDATAQTYILAHVNTALVVSYFGGEEAPKLRLARIYLAAHYATATKSGATAAAGPVTLEMVGRVMRQYASPTAGAGGTDPLLDSTSYGKLFQELCRNTPARAPVAI